MPNRAFHRAVGTGAGAVAAGYRYGSLPAFIAGSIGGNVGSAIPDWLEPATAPNHRDIIHSWTTASAVATTAPTIVHRFDAYAALQVQYHEAQALREPVNAGWHSLFAFLWSIAGAFLVGVLAGFGSHLVCDALTPQSLPLLVNGF